MYIYIFKKGRQMGTICVVSVELWLVFARGHLLWEQKFGFIKRVDKGWITTVKDLESWRFER